ncbi:MAG: response regulator transcription factor [Bryobacterales bacterium]|nr:response regulator transcription factor [Bryobacterales bacterium]
MPSHILLVEDDRNLASVLTDTLRSAGYAAEHTADLAAERVACGDYDLVILDVLLPRENGFTLCRRLRDCGVQTPVLMLTALNDPASIVKGLEGGADDYVTKPFDPAVLLARIQALLRREAFYRARNLAVYEFAGITIDFARGTLRRGPALVSLSGKELQLLRHLIARRGEIVSRHELLREVWGYSEAITRTVDVHIAALRQKLEQEPHHPAHIVTVRGEGYRFTG